MIRLLDKPLCEGILPFYLCIFLKNSRASIIVNCIVEDLGYGNRDGKLSCGVGGVSGSCARGTETG